MFLFLACHHCLALLKFEGLCFPVFFSQCKFLFRISFSVQFCRTVNHLGVAVAQVGEQVIYLVGDPCLVKRLESEVCYL